MSERSKAQRRGHLSVEEIFRIACRDFDLPLSVVLRTAPHLNECEECSDSIDQIARIDADIYHMSAVLDAERDGIVPRPAAPLSWRTSLGALFGPLRLRTMPMRAETSVYDRERRSVHDPALRQLGIEPPIEVVVEPISERAARLTVLAEPPPGDWRIRVTSADGAVDKSAPFEYGRAVVRDVPLGGPTSPSLSALVLSIEARGPAGT